MPFGYRTQSARLIFAAGAAIGSPLELFVNDFRTICIAIHNEKGQLGRRDRRCPEPEFLPGEPRIDTVKALKASRHANMKELRFSAADGEWRVAFAFDPNRIAILLVAGDKSGASTKGFHRELIRKGLSASMLILHG